MFTTVLCDLDGTLVDSSQDIAAAFQHGLGVVTPGQPPTSHSIAQHIGKPLAQMTIDLGYRLSPSQLGNFLAAYRHYFNAHGVQNSQLYPGVTATLLTLSSQTFGIVTTKHPDHATAVLRHLQLAHFFSHIQGATPGLQLKPAPDTVLAALHALQCPPAQTLMVGDTAADILAGKAAGLKTCAVTYGFGDPQELIAAKPDYCIASFGELLEIVQGPGPR